MKSVTDRLDVCLWTKNSAKLLPRTLQRFEEVVPEEVVGKKILVDDHSSDNTTAIAKGHGWRVYENPKSGVASGANEALRHVSTPFFISIEHDVLLANGWWPKIWRDIVTDPRVAVAQGWRAPTNRTLRAILADNVDYSIDNNIYRTDIIRQVGGFPNTCVVCTDSWLKRNLEDAGYKWLVDARVVSEHVRSGVMQEAAHRSRLHRMCTCKRWSYPTSYVLRLTLMSPASGLKLALKHDAPAAFFAYPYLRVQILQGWLSGEIARSS